jgi:hypothetical protein
VSAVILQPAEQHWSCPNCAVTAVTTGRPNRYHNCGGLRGLLAPMVLDGFRGRVIAVEREDYVGGELLQCDGEGRPVMAVVTERPDGSNDVMVNVPTAQGAVT